jgi:hypothetical protein
VGGHGVEVVDALRQRVPEIGKADAVDGELRGCIARAKQHVRIGHGRLLKPDFQVRGTMTASAESK